MVTRFNSDTRSFPISGLYRSLRPPCRNEQGKCPRAGTCDAGGDTEGASDLPTAECWLLHAEIPSSQKISFTVALLSGLESASPFSGSQQCCIDPFIT